MGAYKKAFYSKNVWKWWIWLQYHTVRNNFRKTIHLNSKWTFVRPIAVDQRFVVSIDLVVIEFSMKQKAVHNSSTAAPTGHSSHRAYSLHLQLSLQHKTATSHEPAKWRVCVWCYRGTTTSTTHFKLNINLLYVFHRRITVFKQR